MKAKSTTIKSKMLVLALSGMSFIFTASQSFAATNADASVPQNLDNDRLAPVQYTNLTDFNTLFKITPMLLPSDYSFVGSYGWETPNNVGTYTIFLNTYDAGLNAAGDTVAMFTNTDDVFTGTTGLTIGQLAIGENISQLTHSYKGGAEETSEDIYPPKHIVLITLLGGSY